MALKTYRSKRSFDIRPEPRGRIASAAGHRYVIQKHAARSLHYDLRLELGGVMKSWAVTRGPSLVPGEKRLAIHVEDHPIEYNAFEGTIPKGQYGGGTVMIWDRGRWYPEGDPEQSYRKGRLTFRLDGEKLHGRWYLVRMHRRAGERQDPWLLIKADDEAARSARAPDILEEAPWSAATKRTLDEIAQGEPARKRRPAAVKTSTKSAAAKRTGRSKTKPVRARSSRSRRLAQPARQAAAVKRSKAVARRAARPGPAERAVELTHPDRVYWDDVGVTKQELADYYRDVWDRMAPHVVGRPLALLRCPDGASGQCFFQKHAHATFNQGHIVRQRSRGEELIAIADLDGMVALVQAGVLEIHVWGSTLAHIDLCDRMVFDLDPGPGVSLAEVVAATKETRARLAAFKLESFVKTRGGKGFHVMVPLAGANWDETPRASGRIFIDYLRNGRGATSVAAYSTRARAGAPVSVPLDWSELNARLAPNKFTVRNLHQRLVRLRHDPWRDLSRIRQKLPMSN